MFVGVGVYQTRLFLGDSVVVERNSEQNEEMRERGGEEEEGYRKVAVDSWCNSNKAIQLPYFSTHHQKENFSGVYVAIVLDST